MDSNKLHMNKYITEVENENYQKLSKKSQDIIIINSFPRSGNTWMRYLLSNVLLQKIENLKLKL